MRLFIISCLLIGSISWVDAMEGHSIISYSRENDIPIITLKNLGKDGDASILNYTVTDNPFRKEPWNIKENPKEVIGKRLTLITGEKKQVFEVSSYWLRTMDGYHDLKGSAEYLMKHNTGFFHSISSPIESVSSYFSPEEPQLKFESAVRNNGNLISCTFADYHKDGAFLLFWGMPAYKITLNLIVE